MTCSDESVSWRARMPQLVHPSKLMIVEAIRWIERPLSANELRQVLEEEVSLSTISYHLATLESLGLTAPGRIAA
jgi:DNA-binding transcriptional ArsR family regulator